MTQAFSLTIDELCGRLGLISPSEFYIGAVQANTHEDSFARKTPWRRTGQTTRLALQAIQEHIQFGRNVTVVSTTMQQANILKRRIEELCKKLQCPIDDKTVNVVTVDRLQSTHPGRVTEGTYFDITN